MTVGQVMKKNLGLINNLSQEIKFHQSSSMSSSKESLGQVKSSSKHWSKEHDI